MKMDPWDVFGEERTEQVDSLACLNHEWRLFGRIAAADMKKRQLSGNSVEQEQQLMDDFGTVLDLLDCAAERVKCFAAAERCCSIALDRLQAQGWPHACWREAYVVCQVILAVLTDHDTSGHVPSTTGSPIELPSNRILNALNRLDLCFILGGPPHLLTELVDHFEQEYIPGSVNCEESSAINRDAGDCECTFTSDRLAVAPITSVQNLSPERFFSHFFRTNTPVLIRSAALHWPAIKCWTMEYLCSRYGHRLVPVEIGQLSTKAGDTRREWKEKVFSLGDFVAQYMVGDGGETAYMAQHPLFEQIPLLKNDIEPPSILGTKEVTRTNCWIGTSGTITPFHFDSYENIFCQVKGAKCITLASPRDTPNLYPISSSRGSIVSAQGNISPVSLENPDFNVHPLFEQATLCQAVVRPGDMLYIPEGWWHCVRSLSPSISVNFWF